MSRRDLVPVLRRVLDHHAERTRDLRQVRVVGIGTDGVPLVQSTTGECVVRAPGSRGELGQLQHLPPLSPTLGEAVPSAAAIETELDPDALYVDGGDLAVLACASAQTLTLRGQGFRESITAEFVEHPEITVAVAVVSEEEIELSFTTPSGSPAVVGAGSIHVVSDGREATAEQAYSLACSGPEVEYLAIAKANAGGGNYRFYAGRYSIDGIIIDSRAIDLPSQRDTNLNIGGWAVIQESDGDPVSSAGSIFIPVVATGGFDQGGFVILDYGTGTVAQHVTLFSDKYIIAHYLSGWVYYIKPSIGGPSGVHEVRRCRTDGSGDQLITSVGSTDQNELVTPPQHPPRFTGSEFIFGAYLQTCMAFPIDGSAPDLDASGVVFVSSSVDDILRSGAHCPGAVATPSVVSNGFTGQTVAKWNPLNRIEVALWPEIAEWRSGGVVEYSAQYTKDGGEILFYINNAARKLRRANEAFVNPSTVVLDPLSVSPAVNPDAVFHIG